MKFRNILLLLGFFFFFPFITHAAISNNPAADTQFWIRLTANPVEQNNTLLIQLNTGTVAQTPNNTVYIAECFDTPDDRICTTGTIEDDMVIYQSDENLKKLQNTYGYVFKGLYQKDQKTIQQNPVKTDANGKIPELFWESTISGDVVRKFYGVNIVKETVDEKNLPSNLVKLNTGNVGGQQQASFEVKMPTPVPTKKIEMGAAPEPPCDPVKDPNHCAPREIGKEEDWDGHYDPYGRVFDAVSLEPIPNAKVNLLVQRKNNSFSFMFPKETTNAIINPWTTKEDGKFVYLVPSGTYQLSVDLPNYIFPFTLSSLNPNYTKAYYELYYGQGFTDKNIIEINTVEHRDIPVIPKGQPYRVPVKLLGYMSELDKKKDQYLVTGRTSHPLTVVEILGKKIDTSEVTRVLADTAADKWGFFLTTISTSILNSDETVGSVKMTKIDLTENAPKKITSLLRFLPFYTSFAEKEKPKAPQFTLAYINPLLNYLEGYAYDSNSKPLPNAKVSIYLNGSKKPYYQTKADENGYYNISSQHLPQMNYVIMYTAVDGKNYSITQTTFLEQNLKTILSNNINVNKYVTQSSPFKVVAQEKNLAQEKKIQPTPAVSSTKTSQNNTLLSIITAILVIIIIFILGIILYLKKKQKPPLVSP